MACGAAILIGGCQFLPPPDQALNVDLWNRTNRSYTIHVGVYDADGCYSIGPDELGRLLTRLGGLDAGAPRMVAYSSDGSFVGSLVPSTSDALFILAEDTPIEEVALDYRAGASGSGRLVYDLPQFPELNGRSVPDSLASIDCRLAPTMGPTP